MATIKKKLWKEYFDAVVSGKKKAELRLGDFEVEEGARSSLKNGIRTSRNIQAEALRRG